MYCAASIANETSRATLYNVAANTIVSRELLESELLQLTRYHSVYCENSLLNERQIISQQRHRKVPLFDRRWSGSLNALATIQCCVEAFSTREPCKILILKEKGRTRRNMKDACIQVLRIPKNPDTRIYAPVSHTNHIKGYINCCSSCTISFLSSSTAVISWARQ